MEKIYNYLVQNNGVVSEDFTDLFMGVNVLDIQKGVQKYEEEGNVIDWGDVG